MSGEIIGLKWFEETICHLSAIAHLKRLIVLCDVLRTDSLLSYKDYVILCLHANLGSAQKNCREYLRSNMATLEQPEYHREIYSNLSATILPLFEENNHLWKIILHFGDMRKWDSPEELFDHLLHSLTIAIPFHYANFITCYYELNLLCSTAPIRLAASRLLRWFICIMSFSGSVLAPQCDILDGIR